MIIREIQPNDNRAIANVIRQVFIDNKLPKTGTAFADKHLDSLFEVYDTTRSVYFVVENEEQIIGGCGIAPLENSIENICELQKMYFLPEARGLGMGFQMMQLCLKKAIEFGFDSIYLETLPEMIAAQKLYKKVGFDYLNQPKGATGHGTCPIWMLKTLPKVVKK
jgi:putative acetyltransferase